MDTDRATHTGQGRTSAWRIVAAGAALAVALAGCNATAPGSSASPVATQTGAPSAATAAITLRLDFTVNGKHAPFFLGVKKGYYKEVGIDLQLLEGKGSLSTAQLIASGSDTFGFVDGSALAGVIAGGAPIKMVAGFQQKSPNAAISFEPLAGPNDFIGKTVGIANAGATQLSWAAFLATNKLDVTKIQVVTLDGTALLPALLSGRIQIDIGAANVEGAAAPLQAGKPVNTLLFADWGVNALAHGLVARQETLEKQPDLVKRFIAASVRSWQYALDHQDEAIAAELEAVPQAKKDVLTNQLALSLPLLHSANTQGQPIGKMADQDWAATIDLLKKYGTLKTDLPTSAFYTNDFLP